jgi:hypothetical protein
MTDQTQTKRDMRPLLRRLYNPITGKFLHLSGAGETDGTANAWSGTPEQARRLRAQRYQDQHFAFVLKPLGAGKAAINEAEHL